MTSHHHPGNHDHGVRASQDPSPPSDSHDFDAQWWERHYQDAGCQHAGCQHAGCQDAGCQDAGTGTGGEPSAQLVAEVAGLAPGTVLEAGCGTGADAVWLAGQGWDVTAVDVSPTAVQQARALAAQHEPGPGPISWLVADLTSWQPPHRYDLVVSQYVHPDLPFGEFAARLAQAVGPGGTLLVVGHDHADSHSAGHAPRAASIGIDAVVGALAAGQWEVMVAETRTRQVTRGSGQLSIADLVVKARRRAA
ncbi:MAG: class I SAM-dependent methyltransferase [Jatrophihabitantaceae bacterium]